jgi:hypothetical protein
MHLLLSQPQDMATQAETPLTDQGHGKRTWAQQSASPLPSNGGFSSGPSFSTSSIPPNTDSLWRTSPPTSTPTVAATTSGRSTAGQRRTGRHRRTKTDSVPAPGRVLTCKTRIVQIEISPGKVPVLQKVEFFSNEIFSQRILAVKFSAQEKGSRIGSR